MWNLTYSVPSCFLSLPSMLSISPHTLYIMWHLIFVLQGFSFSLLFYLFWHSLYIMQHLISCVRVHLSISIFSIHHAVFYFLPSCSSLCLNILYTLHNISISASKFLSPFHSISKLYITHYLIFCFPVSLSPFLSA